MQEYQDFQQNKGKRKRKATVKSTPATKSTPQAKRWKFKNPNRRILLGREEITSYDLEINQGLAQILIDKGLSDLLCQE